MSLARIVGKDPAIASWQAGLQESLSRQLVLGLAGSAKTLALIDTFQQLKKSIVIICPNLFYANQLADDLRTQIDEVFVFPVDEVLSAEMAFASPEAKSQRVATLNAISSGQKGIYILPVASLRKALPAKSTWQDSHLALKIGATLDLEAITQKLTLMGYTREQMLAKPGEFSIRGSIIDIYPLD